MSKATLFVCVVFGACIIIDAWDSGKCQPGLGWPMSRFYKGPNDRCYALISSHKRTWAQAHQACTKIDKDAYLVIIHNNRELDWISAKIKYAPGYKRWRSYWIGGQKLFREWKWLNHWKVNMRQPKPWRSGEPNGSGPYMVLQRGIHKTWRFYDRAARKKYGYICEIYKYNLNGDPGPEVSFAAAPVLSIPANAKPDTETPR